MDLQQRIDLMAELGKHLQSKDEQWEIAKENATRKNGWFVAEFVQNATDNIAEYFLQKDLLEQWAAHYHLDDNITQKTIGIVMAGNIPLVGFHDFLCVFVVGHKQMVKLSEKDDVLMKYIVGYLASINPEFSDYVQIADRLSGCDAYIATGSTNTSRYFEQYFGKYPHIIRKNKTSVAVLMGDETKEDLENLADDVHLYFGFGCRNVTKIFVPERYNFEPLVQAFEKYKYFDDHHKYRNNFDYQLSLVILNKQYYMVGGPTLITENKHFFSPPAHLFFEHYQSLQDLEKMLSSQSDIQCLVGKGFEGFGKAQQPQLMQYADGVDTMQFLLGL